MGPEQGLFVENKDQQAHSAVATGDFEFYIIFLLLNLSKSGIDQKPRRKLFSLLKSGSSSGNNGGLEVMGLEYFILPFVMLSVGLICSGIVFMFELNKGETSKKK